MEFQIVQQFSSELKAKIQHVLNVNLSIGPKCIILGIQGATNLNTPINSIYLAAKMYIFKTLRKKGLLSADSFCIYLEKIYQEHEFISQLDFQEEKFKKAWGNFNNLFLW